MIVLGGNAFVQAAEPLTMSGQFRLARRILDQVTPLLRGDARTIITHGNGPQVGHMLTRVEESLGKAYSLPLEVCVAESQGELGYVLQQSLYAVLNESNALRPIASLLTQVIVDRNDAAFDNPTKPVGPFYSKQQAEQLRDKGFAVYEDAGRGYRRVVPSPAPLEIVELEVIQRLLEAGVIVIAAGGGGIPVVRGGKGLVGIDAVIDKDLASALLGTLLDSRLMVIVTGVPCAYQFYLTEKETPIGRVTTDEAQALLEEGHFAPGSMRPKIEAAIQFCRRPETRTVICAPDNLEAALSGESGTIIVGSSRRNPADDPSDVP